ncbi:hypothetical protein QR680_017875 [Steinernema hermaphroditum]|uniref:Serpin domain-containing protein n=1 Tax=Steinernema hermaphroditum TaxID=289476 RepID=A0AA39LPW9_9BILA|nr:hypothetical protein QR680_017875 [Steinernema hermaphroditum]
MPPKKRRIAKKAEESNPKAPPEKKSKISKETPEVDFSELFASLALRILTTADGEASIASPSSICLTLAAAAAGARGSTKKEILDSIFGGAEESEINTFLRRTLRELTDITVANAIFVDESFETKQEYKRDLKKYFNAVVQSADFARNGDKEAEKINAYIRKKTKGLIQGLIPPDAISGGTRFVLANAVYLTAKFHDIFDEKDTKLRVFYNEDKTKKKVPTMTGSLKHMRRGKLTHTKQRTYSTANFEYVDFCIGKYHEFQFFVILPKKNSTCSKLKALLLDSNGISFGDIQKEAEPEREVHLVLPKFKIEATFDLVPFLRGCGMQEAFSPAADFSGMSDESVHIDFAGHKAIFEMNEKGVTAVAATYCTSVAVSTYDPFQMIVNRPFLYGICYDGLPLFMGQYY